MSALKHIPVHALLLFMYFVRQLPLAPLIESALHLVPLNRVIPPFFHARHNGFERLKLRVAQLLEFRGAAPFFGFDDLFQGWLFHNLCPYLLLPLWRAIAIIGHQTLPILAFSPSSA
jgi:hypothetical protein